MKTLVISLGGSVIIPEKINTKFLNEFKETLKKHYKTHKFVIVCGGGTIARKYISVLKEEGKSKKEISLAGIRATRMNALFIMQLFGKEADDTLPKNMKEIKRNLAKNNVVICGALRYSENSTSDSTAAALASCLKTEFVNITNVKGLYSDNPKINKKAKLISSISWKDFKKKALAIRFKAGQNFILDQNASVIINKHKIKTYIIGPDMNNLSKIFKNKKFIGTTIYN